MTDQKLLDFFLNEKYRMCNAEKVAFMIALKNRYDPVELHVEYDKLWNEGRTKQTLELAESIKKRDLEIEAFTEECKKVFINTGFEFYNPDDNKSIDGFEIKCIRCNEPIDIWLRFKGLLAFGQPIKQQLFRELVFGCKCGQRYRISTRLKE